jgi:hypothetical protein
MLDSSVDRLKIKPRDLRAEVANQKSNKDSDIFFETIHEDRGLDSLTQDPYVKNDPEPSEESMIAAMGGTITHSHIALMDSSGMNRTIVRRGD